MATVTTLAQPPAPLAAAIGKSAAKYGVPADVLTGIWRVESGSTYPNPAVNSSGYGGLFGTTDWNGPVQAQADLAASILASSLAANNGNLSSALSRYSGGGYTSVPGQTTTGTIYRFAGGSAGGRRGSSGDPTGNQGTGVSVADATGITAISNLLSGGAKGSPEATTLKTIDSVPKFLEFVTSWRFAEIVGGFFLLLVGLYLLGRQFGLSAPVGQAAKGAATVAFPEGRIAKAAAATATAKARPEGRREEIHQARLKTEGARATELRTRTRHRAAMAKQTKGQREAEVRSAYIRGAADAEGFPRSA